MTRVTNAVIYSTSRLFRHSRQLQMTQRRQLRPESSSPMARQKGARVVAQS